MIQIAKIFPEYILRSLGLALGNITQKVFSVVNILILTWYLGIKDFGNLMIIVTIVDVIARFATFSLQNVIYKRMGVVQDLRLVPTVLYLAFFMSLVCYILINVASDFINLHLLDSNDVDNLHTLSLIILFKPMAQVLKSTLVASNRIKKATLVDQVEFGSRTVGIISLVLVGKGLLSIILVYVISSFLSTSYSFLANYSELKSFKFGTSINYLLHNWKLSASLFVSSIGVILIFTLDRIMLGWLASSEVVGYYVLASTLSNLILLIHNGLALVFRPIASNLIEQGKLLELQSIYRNFTNWSSISNSILFIGINLFSILILSMFVEIELARKFDVILLILSFNVMLYIVSGPSTGLLQMSNGFRYEAINVILFVLLNFLLNYWLIPLIGGVGAAIATITVGLVRVIVHYWQIKHLLNLNILGYLSGAVTLTALSIILSSWYFKFPFYFNVILFVITLVVSLFWFVNNQKAHHLDNNQV
ncbi:MAG: oligosaccharide flippase family protein [bacterium]|nr:oligosaccharide flippase family protein [bacterium]